MKVVRAKGAAEEESRMRKGFGRQKAAKKKAAREVSGILIAA
jgi:hypothetical protein